MFEDFPCALTPAEKKTLSSALGFGFWRRPLTIWTGLLATVSFIAVLGSAAWTMDFLDRKCDRDLMLLTYMVMFFTYALIAGPMLRKRGALIEKLYHYIMSLDDGDVPADSPDGAQS